MKRRIIQCIGIFIVIVFVAIISYELGERSNSRSSISSDFVPPVVSSHYRARKVKLPTYPNGSHRKVSVGVKR